MFSQSYAVSSSWLLTTIFVLVRTCPRISLQLEMFRSSDGIAHTAWESWNLRRVMTIFTCFSTQVWRGGVLSSGGLVKTILPRNRVVCQFMTLYRQIVLIEVQILLQQWKWLLAYSRDWLGTCHPQSTPFTRRACLHVWKRGGWRGYQVISPISYLVPLCYHDNLSRPSWLLGGTLRLSFVADPRECGNATRPHLGVSTPKSEKRITCCGTTLQHRLSQIFYTYIPGTTTRISLFWNGANDHTKYISVPFGWTERMGSRLDLGQVQHRLIQKTIYKINKGERCARLSSINICTQKISYDLFRHDLKRKSYYFVLDWKLAWFRQLH